MSKNHILVYILCVYPKINTMDKCVLVFKAKYDKRKFFIEINKDVYDVIKFLRSYDNVDDISGNIVPEQFVFFFFLYEIFISYNLIVRKSIINFLPNNIFAKIYINNKFFLTDIPLALILSLQFMSPIYITEESFIYNSSNILGNEIDNYEEIKNYKLQFYPEKKYSKEFLCTLKQLLNQRKDLDVLYLVEEQLKQLNIKSTEEKDFF